MPARDFVRIRVWRLGQRFKRGQAVSFARAFIEKTKSNAGFVRESVQLLFSESRKCGGSVLGLIDLLKLRFQLSAAFRYRQPFLIELSATQSQSTRVDQRERVWGDRVFR